MPEPAHRCLLISDFNISNLAGYLSNDPDPPVVVTTPGPFGQVESLLFDAGHELWHGRNESRGHDCAVIWTQPHAISESFRRALALEPFAMETLLGEVDAYASALQQLQSRVAFAFVPTWVIPPWQRGLGLSDVKQAGGVAHTLARMNARLIDRLADSPFLHVLDASRWLEAAGRGAFSPQLWYMSKTPFGNGVFKAAMSEIKAALNALDGRARKLVIVDLDNTLWGGVVGEVGWQQLQLGGHDAIGEAYVDFQRALKTLQRRGVVLAIASKNEEATALEALRRHPEMALRPDDFVAWRINWDDKAANIAAIAAELNLGLQAVVFIDDNPAERGRVAEALPEVLVPDWPDDRMLYASTLLGLRCFDTPNLSAEDRQRTQLYAAERERKSAQAAVGSVHDWLRTLDLRVQIEPLTEVNLPRVAQLLNKTNQMNLRTRRLSESDLWAWAQQPGRELWALRVADRFGDAGLTGIVSLSVADGRADITDFVLSCRVFGRQIEEAMTHWLVERARQHGATTLVAHFIATEKNQPCLEFWRARSGFEPVENDLFVWPARQTYPLPDFITLTLQDADRPALD